MLHQVTYLISYPLSSLILSPTSPMRQHMRQPIRVQASNPGKADLSMLY